MGVQNILQLGCRERDRIADSDEFVVADHVDEPKHPVVQEVEAIPANDQVAPGLEEPIRNHLAVGSGTLFAILCGSSVATTSLLGSLLVPEMDKHRYKPPSFRI